MEEWQNWVNSPHSDDRFKLRLNPPWSHEDGPSASIYMAEQHGDFFIRNMVAVVVESRGISKRWVYQQVFHREFLADTGVDVVFLILRQADPHMRPWRYPQITPFPEFDLFPCWTRLRMKMSRLMNLTRRQAVE